ncbi:Ribosomal RNA large subunit methyltransferase I [Aquisphaera giovannonii]|uniref:Ribosomal RNA large subunit methyltransferase I n=1 Tax=Aquisphaera giovannonii TaxID=406548 RepID=A0A5B9W8E7_9BACT|nr:class I SAM-dependent rRNA methyltransferase [Aquisphaera giovannonii]QEH36966.1 Ribosomal RNA large subunit methyltransferase I [Aquisphaera giovannonii]
MTASPKGRICLLPRRARPFFAGHPWVYRASIARIEGKPDAADEVSVFSAEGAFIARGLFNPSSNIVVRLYRWEDEPLDEAFWRSKIRAAAHLRGGVLALGDPGAACRLVFSEGDGLSGLTVDRYDRWLVANISSLAVHKRREMLLEILREVTGCEGILARPDRATADKEGMARGDASILGNIPDGPVGVLENGLKYEVDLVGGQKTGFYCDQRDNRKAVARFCAGGRVLDLFCYTGGFSLNALRHGAASGTVGIDSSAAAIAQARRNASLNGLDRAEFRAADAHEALADLAEKGETFGVVICDPPKYAGQAKDREVAMRGYRRLNAAALRVLQPGGILATCSCSGLVDRASFAAMLGQVAEETRRPIQILEQRGQAADHPVSAACPESDYLKCFLCRVG